MKIDTTIEKRLRLYQISVIFSLLFALVGFSYNVWRMEVSEENDTIRTACFEMLINLSSLEQLIYTAHYDKNIKDSSPRKGWIIIGLLVDLSSITDDNVETQSLALKNSWSKNWSKIVDDRHSVDEMVEGIDSVRIEIKKLLKSLE